MITQDVCTFYDHLAVYDDYGGIVFISDEGQYIAKALGTKNKAAILMNHGLITVGSTVDEAAWLLSLLDRSCDIQLQVEAAAANGLKKVIISDEEAAYNFKMASDPVCSLTRCSTRTHLDMQSPPNVYNSSRLKANIPRKLSISNGRPSMIGRINSPVERSRKDRKHSV